MAIRKVVSRILDTNLDSLTVDTDTLAVDSTNNRVGIGEANPSHLLELQLPTATNGPMLKMSRAAGAYSMYLGVTSDSDMAIYDNSQTERLRFMNEGGVSFDGGSNNLDDYEEGTFDIKINVGGTDSDALTMNYMKVGRLVHVDFQMGTSSTPPIWGPGTLTNAAGGTDIFISTASGYGQLPFPPARTGHSTPMKVRSIRTQNGNNMTQVGEAAVLTWLSGDSQLYFGVLRPIDNRYSVYSAAVSFGDAGARWEKTNTQSDIVFSGSFTYYTNA